MTTSSSSSLSHWQHHGYRLWQRAQKPLYWLYERRLERQVRRESSSLPNHIGMILDGNRRFAKLSGLAAHQGHDLGAQKAEEVLEWCRELGIKTVTMWVFSTDNAGRDSQEVQHLFQLFAAQAKRLAESVTLREYEAKVKIIGDTSIFPEDVRAALENLENVSQHYDKMLLNVAIGYGGREEITHAVRQMLACKAAEGLSLEQLSQNFQASDIEKHLYTAGIPDPDFVIRTSGEIRLSGFLLWQTAYSEYYFCDIFWPSFRKVDFLRALRNYQERERRFGK